MEKIIFKDLPFRPVFNQVIYIETRYDEDVNKYILSHFTELRSYFERAGKEFFYLPLLTLDSSIGEKVLYAAPYLSPKVLGGTPIKSSSLLNFQKSVTVADLGPSLIFNGQHDSVSEESVFDLLPLDDYGKPVSALIGYVEMQKAEAERRQYATPHRQLPSRKECIGESLPMPPERELDSRHRLSSLPIQDFCEAVEVEKKNKQARRYAKKKNFLDRILQSFQNAQTSTVNEEEAVPSVCCMEASADDIPSLKEIEDEKLSVLETARILQELRDNVQRLRLEGVSLMAIHEFIDRQEPLSRMVITPDYRILLPDYNNMEIEMGALPKAIYFLFLRYPEGIVCKHMPDYYNELLGIYRQLRPATDEARLNLTITKVVNPLGNALNENIARIRKAFVEKFDEHLACNYIITGERGQQYAVTLDRGLITWEE